MGVATDYDAAAAVIASRAGFGIKPGLERVRAVCDALASVEEGYPVVHVAGTNGKTSTARMIAVILGAHGLSTGAFLSPQLEAVEDQFEYGGRPMTRDEFAAALTELEPIVRFVEERNQDEVTSFEMLTALAFSWFAERSVDVAVVEAGLGGREDATNVVRSEVAVVTGVAMDHGAFLGGTLEEVAGHKLGILDEGAVLVTGAMDESVLTAAEARVREQDARWFRFGDDFGPDDVERALTGWLFDVEGAYDRYTEVHLRLLGRHQVHNFSVAVAAAEGLLGRSLDEAAVREVAATIAVPGRMESVGAEPTVMLDAAHNPDGMATLVAALAEEFPTTEWTVILGAMSDKDVDGMARLLDPIAGGVVATAATTPRALAPDRLAVLVADGWGREVDAVANLTEAMELARSYDRPILITGSIALVGEARRLLRSK